jgi:hypothetical protein
MFTTGSKWFLGLGVAALVLAVAYGWTTGGTGLGPLTVGYKGGIGDHVGYALLMSIAGAAFFLGILAVAIRDADSSAIAQVAGTELAPKVAPPARGAYWPVLGALGASLVLLGLVMSNVLFFVGFGVVVAVGVEWMVLAWSDRATGDPEVNRSIRQRIMGPFEIPVTGVLIAGGTIFSFSRVFLAASEHGAVYAAIGAGTMVFLLGILLATRPKISSNLVAGLLVVVALGVVSGGVVAAAHGERKVEAPGQQAGTTPTTTATGHRAPGPSNNGLHAHIPQGTSHSTTTTTEAKG